MLQPAWFNVKDTILIICYILEVNILDYAESHAREIRQFTKILKDEPCGQNIAQKIPRHMRRRAMGHDVKRLPRSVRAMVRFLLFPRQSTNSIKIYYVCKL